MSPGTVSSDEKVDRKARILDAALVLLSRQGISGVSMRAVSREAGVALGLVNYYFEDKTSLIRAALHHIEEQDVALVEADAGGRWGERSHSRNAASHLWRSRSSSGSASQLPYGLALLGTPDANDPATRTHRLDAVRGHLLERAGEG